MTDDGQMSDDEDLFRQVHPTQLDAEGMPTSPAFLPSKNDGGLLSTRRAWIGAKKAHESHVALGLESAGSWTINVGHARSLQLPPVDDSAEPGMPPGHASVDFRFHASSGKIRQLARKLRDAARCEYRPS